MKLDWTFPTFSLDLNGLWQIPGGMETPQNYVPKLESLWTDFLEQSKKGAFGFFHWPVDCNSETLQEIEERATQLKAGTQGALCIGIGGSYLGPAAIQEILNPIPEANSYRVHWISNVDSTAIRKALAFLKNKQCSAVIISKSGGTTETLAAWFHLSHAFEGKNILVITDPIEGELRRLSQTEKWMSLPVPPSIGGRFSVLTAVGLLPLCLQGIDIRSLIAGAQGMRTWLLESSPNDNPALWYAFSLFLLDEKNFSTQYLMPYDSRLKLLADWYVQLWGESLGKYSPLFGKAVGPTPVSALGTSDQHSLLQLFKEGPLSRVVGFLCSKESDSPVVGKPGFNSPQFEFLTKHSFSHLNVEASLATQESLQRRGVPTYRFSFGDLTPFSLGAFLFFQEVACALAGELYGVNAFDQPGVEEAKTLLKSKLL